MHWAVKEFLVPIAMCLSLAFLGHLADNYPNALNAFFVLITIVKWIEFRGIEQAIGEIRGLAKPHRRSSDFGLSRFANSICDELPSEDKTGRDAFILVGVLLVVFGKLTAFFILCALSMAIAASDHGGRLKKIMEKANSFSGASESSLANDIKGCLRK